MARFDINRILNNAELQQKQKKKKMSIDRIINNAEEMKKHSSVNSMSNTAKSVNNISNISEETTVEFDLEEYRAKQEERMKNIQDLMSKDSNQHVEAMMDANGNIYDIKKLDAEKVRNIGETKLGTARYVNGNLTDFQESPKNQVSFPNAQQEQKNFIKSILEKGKENLKTDIEVIGSNLKDSALTGGLQFGKTVGMMADNAQNYQINMRKKLLEYGINQRKERGLDTEGLEDMLSDPLYKEANTKPFYQEKIDKISQRMAENTEKASNPFSKKLAELSTSMGNNLVGMGASVINPALGFTYFTGSAMGSYYDEAIEKGMSDSDARNYASIMGLMEGATEQVLSAQNIKGAKDIINGTGLKNAFKSFGLEVGENFVQEAVMPALSELTTKAVAGDNYLKYDYNTLEGWKALGMDSFSDGIDGALSAILLNGTTKGVSSCINVANKIKNGKKVTKQEVKTALSDAQKSGVDVETVIKDQLNEVVRKNDNTLKNNASELPQNAQNNIEQQTILNDTKTAQNRELSQTERTSKIAPVRDLNYIESARKYNLDINNETVQSISRVTNERGINARYDSDAFKNTNQNAIWKINKDEAGNTVREVIINPNADSSKTLENIIVHELTHDFEGTEQYNELKDIILNYDKSKAGYQEARQALEELYSQVYDKNSSEFQTLVENEAVADILGSKLGDQEFLNNLTKQNRTLSQRIYDWVVDKLNKLNAKIGYKSEKLYWADVKNKFENAFNQEYKNPNENTLYSIAGKKGMNNLVKKSPKEYVGLEQSYNKAQQLQKNGVDNETIRQQTNWFQDKNGDWKFEFSDKDMAIKKGIKLENNKTYKLGDILEHDTLFMAYPELANYDVKIFDIINAKGAFNKVDKIININNKLIGNKELIEGTLSHEIQHAIQNIEGFEHGKSSKKSKLNYYNSLGEIEATDTKTRFLQEKYNNKDISKIAPESSKINPQHKDLNSYLKNRSLLDKVKDSVYNYLNDKNRGDNNEISEEYMERHTKHSDLLVDGRRRLDNYSKQRENIKETSMLETSLDSHTGFIKRISQNRSASGEPFSTSLTNSKNSIAPLPNGVNTNTKYSMQERENNAWQDRLDTLYKNGNKGTNIKDIKVKAKQTETNNKIPYAEKYNKYKQNIIKANEKAINDLVQYKNETIRNIDAKISEKQKLLDSKKNKDTKVANVLKNQIESLKAHQTQVENLYNEKIDKFNSKISKEKIELETRNIIKQEARKTLSAEITPLVQDLTKYKDKKRGLQYNRETAQRNIDDIVQDKELATAIKETIFDPIQVHQAEKTREINNLFERINKLNIDKEKKYYYIPDKEIVGIKIDEATLAQLIIEKKINDTDLRNYNISSDGIKKIHNIADTFTEILDYLYNKMNEEQIKYGYSHIGKIQNYFPHFFENKPDALLGKVASYFGIDLTNQNLPTEIAGKTDAFKPGRTWDSNIQKRRTNKTDYDALTAMEKYIVGATDLIYTTEDIQRVREYSRQIRYKYSDKGIQSDIDSIMSNTELTQEAKDDALEGIFKNTENELSNFVTWLDDYANMLANKKAFADRNMERNIGRNVYNSMSGIEGRIAANTIGGNLSVSLTNFAPIFQAAGTTKWNYLLTGMLQTTTNDIRGLVKKEKDISFVTNSNFLTNRFGTDTISKKKVIQKFSDIASIPMNVIDEFASESIVRAKYLENIDRGMSEEKALDLADKYAAKIMADRSKGALPLIFNTKNPLSKLMTMFQVEPNNMVSNYLKDMPRDAINKKQLLGQATKLMVASYAFNTIAMAIRGGNEVLPDPARWVSYLIKAITGDDDEKEKAKKDLTESILGSVPFLSNVAGFVGMEDIGRVPISNAMPNITNLGKLFDAETDSKYRTELALKELSKPLLYLGLPVGGAQIKKTVEGISTVAKGGSYKTNKKGEKELQFPVEDANVGDYLKAGIFGKYSLSDSKSYADRGYKALSAKQTKMYEDANIPYKELIDYLDAGLKKTEDKIEYVKSKKMNTSQMWGIYTNDIFSKTTREDGGSQLSDAKYIISHGVSKKEFIEVYNELKENNTDVPTEEEYKEMQDNGIKLQSYCDYKIKVKKETERKRNLGELEEKQNLKNEDKIQILLDSKYSNKETKAIYENYIKNKEDAEYNIIDKTGINIKEYLKYKQQDFSSDIKDDGTIKGKNVNGSSKRKTYEYVNSMNITYEQRLMLLGMKYTLKDTEQTKLYNYVKNLDCTQKEMQDIFEKLKGFTVYKNGRVTW